MPESQDPHELDEELLDQILEQLIPEAREIIDHLNLCLIQLDQEPKDEAMIETVKRGFHTLKGSSGFAGLDQLSQIAKAFEYFMADVMKGNVGITVPAVNLMYEGLDAIATIIDKAENKDFSQVDAAPLVEKVDMLKTGQSVEGVVEIDTPLSETPQQSEELLNLYRDGYHQLTALKHVVFSSINLSDPESLVVLLTKQILTHLGSARNSMWLADPEDRMVEIARDGDLVEQQNRRILKSEDSEVIQRVLHEQLMIWPADANILQEELAEYQRPLILPLKMKTTVIGLLILDSEEKAELELYQFIAQFAAMMISISKLHQKVEEQRSTLDEMTGILFKQNAHLSAIYHVEMKLLQEKDPTKLCNLVVEALVDDLDAIRAAAFLYNPAKKEFVCTAQNGGFEDIVGQRFPLTAIKALQQGLETGRLIAYIDYGEALMIGPNEVDHWIALGIKGREKVHGVAVVEIGDEELSDAISILTNYLGVLLDNILLQQDK